MSDDQIEVENVNTPGRITRVRRDKYESMRDAMLRVMGTEQPGMTATEIKEAAKQHLDAGLFPGGSTSGWWAKTVQLDLEAKKVLVRSETKPLRWYKA